jgi:hypothetical protein
VEQAGEGSTYVFSLMTMEPSAFCSTRPYPAPSSSKCTRFLSLFLLSFFSFSVPATDGGVACAAAASCGGEAWLAGLPLVLALVSITLAAKGVETLGLGAFSCESVLELVLLLALVGPKANLTKVGLSMMATV